MNRSVPSATVIPVLTYENVGKASDWLCNAFGFSERLRIGSHRAQLVFGDGTVILSERHPIPESGMPDDVSHSVHGRVEDVDKHYARALEHGAQIVQQPADYPYGERQYTASDIGGHRWTFSQSIADIDPATWLLHWASIGSHDWCRLDVRGETSSICHRECARDEKEQAA